jgi:hypothetical protein
MDRLWHRLAFIFGLDLWTAERGAVGAEQYQGWSDGLMDYTVEQINRGVQSLGGWKGSKPPDLNQFARLCLTATAVKPKPADPSPLPASVAPAAAQVAAAELQRQAGVVSSPKPRQQTTGDIESFTDSYHRCGLGRRWPGGHVDGI